MRTEKAQSKARLLVDVDGDISDDDGISSTPANIDHTSDSVVESREQRVENDPPG